VKQVRRYALIIGVGLALPLSVAACRSASAPPLQVAPAEAAKPFVESIRLVTPSGGRLDWYKGGKHGLIAYDAVVNARNRNTEVFTMRADGSAVTCVTCRTRLPKGFTGQPAWHPDGEHLIVQAENANSSHGLFNHMAWGINNDLWLVSRDGIRAERIWRSPKNHGALHPHFDNSGRRVIFAERVATGKVIGGPRLKRMGAGGENPWAGWRIHIAEVDLSRRGEAILSNHRLLLDSRPGFYETHGFAGDDRIVFSHTADGRNYVDDIFVARADGSGLRALVRSPGTWDEHGSFSPSGRTLAFISSRADPDWRFPGSNARSLRTELFLRSGRRFLQVTDFNRLRDPSQRYLVSDFSWGRAGRRIAAQVAPVTEQLRITPSPEIWMITFSARQ
jgi:hypothetical protein